MKGAFRFPMIAGGASPDPAVFCPIEGYYDPDAPDSPVIWNPIDPLEWTLLAEFQTNSPSSATFDPTITAASGEYAWNLGDGSIILGDKSISHTYTDDTTKTVKLYGKGVCEITLINFGNDNLVGVLDISNDAFKTLSDITVNYNASLTSVILPTTLTNSITVFNVQNSGLTGTLDLTSITNLNNIAINLSLNLNLTGVAFASSVSGTAQAVNLSVCNITGALDVSMFNTAGPQGLAFIYATNPLLTSITYPTSITGQVSQLIGNDTGISGVHDVSVFTSFYTNALIYFHNTAITGITFASSITGSIAQLSIYNTSITGNLAISMFTAWSTTAQIILHTNPLMTGITFASSVTGTFSSIRIHATGITGVLNVSMFTSYTATAIVSLNNNASMTGVTFPASTITGFIRNLSLYSNTSLGYVDLTKLRTAVNSLNWDMKNNGWTATMVNQVLVNIDSIAAAGNTSRVINIGGTNADPDTTSGGYNGSAARTSLQGKAFTVTIT